MPTVPDGLLPDGSLLSLFSSLPDPRVERTKTHSLMNVLIITICIAETIHGHDVEHVLPLKENQPTLRTAVAVRNHWCIENQLHWVLDVAFDEDNKRSCTGHSAHSLAIVHQIALNLVKQEKTARMGVKNKRLTAGWSDTYLAKVLFS